MNQRTLVQPLNMKTTRISPDLSLGFVALAPIVTEARAFIECGEYGRALDALTVGLKVIRECTTPCVACDLTPGCESAAHSPGMDAETWVTPRQFGCPACTEDAGAQDHSIDSGPEPIR
jgi:hypothetical protein